MTSTTPSLVLRSLFRRSASSLPSPKSGKRNTLITAALPYVNNEPHLGNIIGCVLSADAFARFARLRGDNTLYICGTDEYGTATEIKAQSEGISCQELCDRFYKIHKQIYSDFDIDFDHFGRTTNKHQKEIAQDIFLKLKRNGHLIKQSINQLYCESCSRFLADRYVEGACPHCAYPDARGDQCDGCQSLLNAAELVNPRCQHDGSRPVPLSSNHMFLDLAKFVEPLKKHVADFSSEKWSSNAISVTRGWLGNPLHPRCITRDLKWGTPVPVDSSYVPEGSQKGAVSDFTPEEAEEFRLKVFYVWFDAPIGYLSITASYTNEWEKWWKTKPEDDVRLFQFMGKDNTPFHTIIFPSSLIGTKDPWTLVRHISTTEYLNYEGTKFSKSRGIGVFGSHVKFSGVPIAAWRYYLFCIRPETSDSDFSWSDFVSRNNNELLKNPGNLVNRVIKFAHARFGGKVPEYNDTEPLSTLDKELFDDVKSMLTQYNTNMDNLKIKAGLLATMALSARANQYLADSSFDNSLFESNPKRCAQVLVNAVDIICILSSQFYPFIPSTSASINRQLGLSDEDQPNLPVIEDDAFPRAFLPGHVLGKPEYLFHQLPPNFAETMREKFGSKPSEEVADPSSQIGKPGSKVQKKSTRKSTGFTDINHSFKTAEYKIKELAPEEIPSLLASLQDEVSNQASKIRELKAGNKSEDVRTEVAKLLALKQKFVDETTMLIEKLTI